METMQYQYERDGFYIAVERVVPDDVLEGAQKGMEAVRDGVFDLGIPPTEHPGYDPKVLCKINNPHRSDQGLYGLATCPEVGRKVAETTGSMWIQVWASQLLIKPPGSKVAGHVGWHQDRQYWKMWQGDKGLFTVWIALCDVGELSGPVNFVRGSHRWGFLDQGNFFDKDQNKLRKNIDMPPGEAWEEVPAIISYGGLSIHDCLTYHGSGANVSEAARWSIALHLRDERARPVPDDEGYYTAHLDDLQICPLMYEA